MTIKHRPEHWKVHLPNLDCKCSFQSLQEATEHEAILKAIWAMLDTFDRGGCPVRSFTNLGPQKLLSYYRNLEALYDSVAAKAICADPVCKHGWNVHTEADGCTVKGETGEKCDCSAYCHIWKAPKPAPAPKTDDGGQICGRDKCFHPKAEPGPEGCNHSREATLMPEVSIACKCMDFIPALPRTDRLCICEHRQSVHDEDGEGECLHGVETGSICDCELFERK